MHFIPRKGPPQQGGAEARGNYATRAARIRERQASTSPLASSAGIGIERVLERVESRFGLVSTGST